MMQNFWTRLWPPTWYLQVHLWLQMLFLGPAGPPPAEKMRLDRSILCAWLWYVGVWEVSSLCKCDHGPKVFDETWSVNCIPVDSRKFKDDYSFHNAKANLIKTTASSFSCTVGRRILGSVACYEFQGVICGSEILKWVTFTSTFMWIVFVTISQNPIYCNLLLLGIWAER